MHEDERRAGPWRYIESADGDEKSAIRVQYDNNFIKLADADLVFDVASDGGRVRDATFVALGAPTDRFNHTPDPPGLWEDGSRKYGELCWRDNSQGEGTSELCWSGYSFDSSHLSC